MCFIKGKFSQFKPVVSGVPQGSVLCLLLFILPICELSWKIKLFHMKMAQLCMLKWHFPQCTNVANSLNSNLD